MESMNERVKTATQLWWHIGITGGALRSTDSWMAPPEITEILI